MGKITATERLTELRQKNIPQGPYNLTPYFVSKARGAVITDVEGREFIDFAGGIGAMNVGHCHPKVVAAIKDQAEKFTHTCFHVMMYEPYVELADKLCRLAPGSFPKMAMFINSGAEAVENAVKAARYFTKRQAIITLEHAYHGRTLLTMTLTSDVKPYKFGYGPFAPEVYRMPGAYCYRCTLGLKYPGCDVACADYLKEMFIGQIAAEQTAAVIAEPIQGEGGFITPPPEYFPKLKKICEENGILLIVDEVQSGIGRTGKMFAIEHWGVEPDLITIAKSLAAGMPLSSVVGRKDVLNASHVGGLGGTYAGNPVCCRAALAVLEIFQEEDLLSKAVDLGEKVRSRLEQFQKEFEVIGEVRGKGVMLCLELVKDRNTKEPAADETKALITYAHEHGLILLSCGSYKNVIRILMPLVITYEQLERGLSIMADGFAKISK
jgi:4-aminobutyrate aminotransferase/(S)-3-amino-2-methylpropionate transaminase